MSQRTVSDVVTQLREQAVAYCDANKIPDYLAGVYQGGEQRAREALDFLLSFAEGRTAGCGCSLWGSGQPVDGRLCCGIQLSRSK